MIEFTESPFFSEQIREAKTPDGVRMIVNAPAEMHADRPTLIIFYATPNGNTVEQTLGCAVSSGLDWHYDIQHIAAQTRMLREIRPYQNIVLVCLEAEGLSWPSWRQKRTNSTVIIKGIVESLRKEIAPDAKVTITGHSGGGSFVFGFINACDEIPSWIDRIAFLDSNYGYSDKDSHGEKLLAWVRGNPQRHLVVIAYDDRNILLNGRKVVSDTGGTYRASHRMLDRFKQEISFKESVNEDIDCFEALKGQIVFYVHRNPANKILHTALVGDMNGYLEAMTLGTPEAGKWGRFGGPRACTKWIQPGLTQLVHIPARLDDAPGGSEVMKKVAPLNRDEREAVILTELKRGNLPGFLRRFVSIRYKAVDANGKEHSVSFDVMPDYLTAGSDKDFVRIPVTPMTAQALVDAFDCSLPTRKMVDEIYKQAEVKLEPRPLTENREAVETFLQHHKIIESQRAGKPLGKLVAGIKKDVVITNLLYSGKPNRVAIYGWHMLDGSPIQPLTTVHVNWYVDYSHGVRLVKRTILIDDKPRDIREVLADPILHPLLSDEGPIAKPYY